MSTIRQRIKDYLRRKQGIDINRYPLYRLLRNANVDLVFDVGANRGQFAEDLYKSGYTGRCLSFEPIPNVYHVLRDKAAHDESWDVYNCALGKNSGTRKLHVTKQDASSSFYTVNERYGDMYSNVLTESEAIDVSVKTIDEIFQENNVENNRTFLKIDVQGAEMDVLEGSERSIKSFYGIQIEVSLSSIYDDSPLIEDIIKWVRAKGFKPVFIKPGFKNPENWIYYDADVLFVNTDTSVY